MTGLTQLEAQQRLQIHGPNKLPEPKQPGLALIFLCQFKSPFIYVLLVAAFVSFVLGQTINSFFIFVVLLINAAIGTFQEYAAQKAAFALKRWALTTQLYTGTAHPSLLTQLKLYPATLLCWHRAIKYLLT